MVNADSPADHLERHCRAVQPLIDHLPTVRQVKPEPVPSAESPAKRHRDVVHSPDFTEVTWHGNRYLFTKTQARAIEILWRGWETGGATVAGASIVRELDLGSTRTLAAVFRGHEAWGKLIIPCPVKGAYRLNDPADPVLQVASENKQPSRRKAKRIGTRIGKRTGTRK